ncbi:MAG: hypothetical protein K6G25_02125 [Bacteroidales bacterium]|nr:hypothetical protein [Bacteroidales bacterium]
MKRHILIATLILLAVTVYAQHDEQVTVEGKYRPKVNKVSKLQLTPETPQPSYDFPSSEVNPMDAKQKFAIDLEKIAPTGYAAKNDKLVTPTQNFLMAGIGTRLSPLFLYKHNSMLTKTLGLGVGIKHNSSWVNIKDYAPSNYMNNAFDINLSTSKINGFQLEGGVYFKNDRYHLYGVDLTENPLTEEQIEVFAPKITYNRVGGYIGLASTTTRLREMNHAANLDYFYLFNREHAVDFDYSLGYANNFWGDKSHPQNIGVDLGFQYDYCMGQGDNSFVVSRVLFKVNPFFEMGGEFYRLHLGVRLDGATKASDEDKFLAVRPDVSGSLFVLNKKLEFYAGLNGGRKLLRFGDVVEDNPFLSPLCSPSLGVPNVKLGFEGGVRTNIMEAVDLHLGVRYRHTDDDPLFVYYLPDATVFPSGMDPVLNSFDIVYDETQLVSIMADLRVKLRNSFTADLGFAYNNWKTTNEEYAWYRPTTEGKLKLTYDFNDKLAFNTTFLYLGGRYAKVWDGVVDWQNFNFEAQKLKDVFDLSIGADYKVNDQITAFALFDNVAHQKYHLYYNYPVTGIQFYAGVKLRF